MRTGESSKNRIHAIRGIMGEIVELDLEMADPVHQVGFEHALEQLELSPLDIHLH